jgi:hypothetical protein
MYTELIIGGETFKLRLNTRNSIQLEKALGYNPLNLLMAMEQNKMPRLYDIIVILQSMLQSFHHGYTIDKTMDLFDKYVEDGHGMFDLIPVFIEVFKQSGYISEQTADEETEGGKN